MRSQRHLEVVRLLRQNRLICAVLFLCVASSLGILILTAYFDKSVGVSADSPEFPYEQVGGNIHWHIQNEQVEPLRDETLEQSLQRLWDVDMYCWPGGGFGSGGRQGDFPLTPEDGRKALSDILSNRRFLKTLEELRKLPRADAAKLVNSGIEKSLPIYLEMFDANLKKWGRYLDPGSDTSNVGFGHQTSNNPDGTPTLLGVRYKTLALALIASELELTECHSNVKRVCKSGIDQYVRLSDGKRFNTGVTSIAMALDGLYNQQIIAAALVRTCADPTLSKTHPIVLREMEMPHFDAKVTPFDLHAAVVPPDYSKGKIIIRFAADLTDQEFFVIAKKYLDGPVP